MKILYASPILALLLLTAVHVHSRDPEPLNSKFNIGQDIITSDGYGLLNIDNPYLLKRESQTDIALNSSISYGISRFLGITFTMPFYLKHTIDSFVTRGLSDISTTIQFHLYRTDDQLVVFKSGLQFPTGNTTVLPPLGSGSFNPTLSLEVFHSTERFFTSILFGANIATPRKHKKSGTVLDYEITAGPKFPLRFKKGSQLYTFFELQGLYTFASKLNGQQVPDTGEHLFLLGPLLSYEDNSDQYFLRLQFPIAHTRRGSQPKATCLISLGFQRDL